MSQCPHCRGLRKARATHVKCECGEKPHNKADCVHTDKGDPKSELGGEEHRGTQSDHDTVDHTCCCTHGLRCTCALKKDHLDPVPEIDVAEAKSSSPSSTGSGKPRLSTAKSDTSLTVFSNGHHKPVHRNNHAAQECGVPYKIPRPHSIHGHVGHHQRSVDNLPSSNMDKELSQFQDSVSSAQQDVRLSRSEHGSPDPKSTPTFDQLNGKLPLLDLSYSTLSNDHITSSPVGTDYTSQTPNNFEPYLHTPDEQISFSPAINAPPAVDWSAFDLPLDNGAFSTTYSQPPSYASFDHSNISRPGLTASSSGEVSEIEDLMPASLPSPEPSKYPTSAPEQGNMDSYRLSSSSYMSMPQASLLAGNNIESLTLDTYFPDGTGSPADFEDCHSGAHADAEAFTRHGFTIQEAQKLAHPGNADNEVNELTYSARRDDNDPPWASAFGDDGTNYDGIDEREGADVFGEWRLKGGGRG